MGFYEEDYQTVRLDEQFNREALIGPEIEHTVTIPSLSFDEGVIRLSPDEPNDGFTIYQGDEKKGKLLPHEPYQLGSLTLILMDAHHNQHIYYLGNRVELSFSREEKDEIDVWKEQAHSMFQDARQFTLEKIEGTWYAMPQDETIYVNGKKIHGPEKIYAGDELFWNFLTVTFKDDDLLQVTAYEPFHTRLEKQDRQVQKQNKNTLHTDVHRV